MLAAGLSTNYSPGSSEDNMKIHIQTERPEVFTQLMKELGTLGYEISAGPITPEGCDLVAMSTGRMKGLKESLIRLEDVVKKANTKLCERPSLAERVG